MRLFKCIIIALFFSSCAVPLSRPAFLSENISKISQGGIKEAWGLPESASMLNDGRQVWVYKVVTRGTPPRVYLPPAVRWLLWGQSSWGLSEEQPTRVDPGDPGHLSSIHSDL